MSFTHLHVHTEYSLLDGAARIRDVIARAKELGMDSLAITDHGVMFGVVDFYKEAIKQGIKPILGCEVYTAGRTRLDKEIAIDKQHGHLILLAENNEGYKNLMKIVSTGFTEGFYYKPRIDYEVLRNNCEGLICLSGCLSGRVQQALLRGDYKAAKQEAFELLDIFGKDHFYLEIQNQGIEDEYKIIPELRRLSFETGIPLVATNDVHYVKKDDAQSHDALLCIQTATYIDERERMRFPTDEFYLKSENEMRHLFADLPEALSITSEIAERCNVELEFGKLHLPEFKSPSGFDNVGYLRMLCDTGCKARYGNITPILRERLEYELETIENMEYVEYFLIVWDFINYAKGKGIMVGPGRGSAAGSIVAYCLRITDIDPIKNGLIFERFLNPERISMPDIDIDFCYERRQEVIDYVVHKYGEDKVAQIITFGTMKAKAAVRDVGRVLRMSYSEVDAIAKMIPFDLNMTIEKAMDVNPDLKNVYDSDGRIKKLLDMARSIEGMPRHVSTHAAGVVISKKSLVEYVPLYLSDKGISTQFSMTTIEELGLLKMDFLGLRNLTVIRDALEIIKREHGNEIDFSSMDYDDSKVYEQIASGNTQGVFQLESMGMTQFMKSLKPDHFEDIVAGISLYRPGPMDSIPKYIKGKKDKSKIRYAAPQLEPILSVTYGCLVYQEQVMQIVRDLGGYSYGRSDLVRRAMSKKKAEVMKQEREHFVHGMYDNEGNLTVPGCIRNGISESAANEIFDEMVKFAEYAFNKSHAAAYAVLAYETAWLKTHYTVEFMAALMTSVISEPAMISKYIRNCKELGIEVLPPDIIESDKKFSVKEGKIRFGLLGIKNVGEGIIDSIIKARQDKGKPKDIFEFINSIDVKNINKKAVESLIRAGALDSLNPNRAQHMAVYENLIETIQSNARKNIEGQMSLFSDFPDVLGEDFFRSDFPDVKNFDSSVLMSMEKEMLGVYVTGHPLDKYAERLNSVVTVNSEMLASAEEGGSLYDGKLVVAGGMITHIKTQLTKNNQIMAFVEIEDLFGICELIVFPGVYESSSESLKEDRVVIVRGKLNFKEGESPKILANGIAPIDEYTGAVKKDQFQIKIPVGMDVNETLTQLSQVLRSFPGDSPVIITIGNTGKKLKTDSSLWVKPEEKLYEALYEIIGRSSVL